MPWTDPATWSVGELVLASKMNTHVRDNLNSTAHLLAYKSADESVTSSTVLQDDDHLLLAVGINDIWYVRFAIYVIDNSSSTADFKWAFTWPSGTTAAITNNSVNVGDTFSKQRSFTASGTGFSSDAALAGDTFIAEGVVTVGGTAGNLRLQWAQSVSNASSVVVKKGSNITGFKLA